MIRINRISSKEGIHHYVFNIMPDIHNQLISFFNDLDFSQDELLEIDTPFSELDGEYVYIKNKDIKVHIFICNNKVNMVIDSTLTQEKLTNLMQKYFIFPK